MAPMLRMRRANATSQPKTPHKSTVKSNSKTLAATTKHTKAVLEPVLTQQQSFELVRIGINVAISQYVFARQFFPSEVYKTRMYDASDPTLNYNTFMSGSNLSKKSSTREANNDNTIQFNSLVRGTKHRGVDKLLDWLDHGVAKGVEDRCLAQVQLSLYHKEVTRDQLLEAFTMSFTYDGDTTGIQVTTSTSGRSGTMIQLRQAKEGLKCLINQVMNNTQNIGSRSGGHKVSMQLLYNQNAPPNAEYPGFCAGGEGLLIPEDTGTLMGNMNTGIHSLSMRYYFARPMEIEMRAQNDYHYVEDDGRDIVEQASRNRSQSPFGSRFDRASLASNQGEGTQPTSVEYLNGIHRRRGPNDMDTQPFIEPEASQIDFGIQGGSTSVGDDSDIQCECRCTEDEDNLIRCTYCQGDFHSQCYGYRGKEPSPRNFKCYSCSFGTDNLVLVEKISMVVRRRAIFFLEKHGFHNLGHHMNLSDDETMKLIKSLRAAGITKSCPKSSEDILNNIENLHQKYFNPSEHTAFTAAASAITRQGSFHPMSTPRRFGQPRETLYSTHRSEGSTTMSPSSVRSSHANTGRGSPELTDQSTTHLARQTSIGKRMGDDISANASKKRRGEEVLASSPFSIKSSY